MAQTVCPFVSVEDRARLTAVASDRNARQKHVQRACIILASADGANVMQTAKAAGATRPAVWRWQQRFAEEGVEGLLRDKTRKPGKKPVSAERTAEIVALTCSEPPGEATHWTGRAMATATGLSLRTVQRIWAMHGLQPHRIRTFKRSRDPDFIAKLEDIVGLYMAPPRHAIVLSVDEKSQIQALDRTQPGLPMKPGKAGTMTHDYIRHGTTTLFAALNVLDGTVIGKNMQRHRHQEFIRFLNAVERAIPAGKIIHTILDKSMVSRPSIPICEAGVGSKPTTGATHKHPKVRAWLTRHPRWIFHFTPTSCSPRPPPDGRRFADGSIASCDRWLNAVESFFSKLTRQRIRRGAFSSLVDLQAAINRYLDEHNADPKPFTWTATPKSITTKLHQVNASVH